MAKYLLSYDEKDVKDGKVNPDGTMKFDSSAGSARLVLDASMIGDTVSIHNTSGTDTTDITEFNVDLTQFVDRSGAILFDVIRMVEPDVGYTNYHTVGLSFMQVDEISELSYTGNEEGVKEWLLNHGLKNNVIYPILMAFTIQLKFLSAINYVVLLDDKVIFLRIYD